MKDATTSFAERMYKDVDDSVEQLEKTLTPYWKETRGLQEQIPIVQQ